MSEAEDNDPVMQALLKLRSALIRDAEARGDGPGNWRKSEFKTEDERASFIDAWGIDAYRKLRD